MVTVGPSATPRFPRTLQRRLFRTRDAEAAGLPRARLYRLVRAGQVTQLGRGLFSAGTIDLDGRETLAEAAVAVPNGVVCLLSALAFHGLTTQQPRDVWMAIAEKAWKPVASGVPLRIVRFSGPALTEGVETHRIGSAELRVYSPAKTLADCFKYRNKIGLDLALEALRDYTRQRKGTLDELMRYAAICRVANVMRPYLEALVE